MPSHGSQTHHIITLFTRALVLAAALFLAGAASVQGATLDYDQDRALSYTYTAAAGEANDLTVSTVPGGYRFADAGASISRVRGAVPHCTQESASSVRCSTTHTPTLRVNLADAADRFRNQAELPSDVSLGAGDDSAVGGGSRDVLRGGDANDTLSGGGGDDSLQGGAGADTLAGGAGSDSADYSEHTASVHADLEGDRDDGSAGEGDLIGTDVENLGGGSGNDTLTGNDGPNVLLGGAGDDRLYGLGGDDVGWMPQPSGDPLPVAALVGGPGKDELLGGAGDDRLDGGGSAGDSDFLSGGPGTDTLTYFAGFPLPTSPSLRVSLDGVADDGVQGENDQAGPDIENLVGGGGSDVLIGNDQANVIAGGGASGDVIEGRDGDDTLIGSYGTDRIDGGTGRDSVRTYGGDDTVLLREGTRDQVFCVDYLPAAVTVQADNLDVVDCEGRGGTRVQRPIPPPTETPPGSQTPQQPSGESSGGSAPGGTGQSTLNDPEDSYGGEPDSSGGRVSQPGVLRILRQQLRLERRGRMVRVRMRCAVPAGKRCSGRLLLTARLAGRDGRRARAASSTVVVVGSTSYRLRSGRRTVRVKLSRPARRLVVRQRRLRVRVSASWFGRERTARTLTMRRR